MKQSLAFHYAHSAATMAPSKQTATQIKGRVLDTEISENATDRTPQRRSWRKVDKHTSGKDMGNVIHTVLQHISFAACTDVVAIAKEVSRLQQLGYITDEQVQWVDPQKIATFFQTDIGKRILSSSDVLREFKFSILDDGENYDASLAIEKILLQGVVDCAIVEPDGITVVDFKTDRITEKDLDQAVDAYRFQVKAYSDALTRIYDKPVKAAYLYFFKLNKLVSVL